jgi:hypothetical protein
MGVLEQGVKFLPAELGCRGTPMSVVQSDEVNLTRDEVWKARGVPAVFELFSEGVLKFVRIEC